MRYILITLLIITFTGCSSKKELEPEEMKPSLIVDNVLETNSSTDKVLESEVVEQKEEKYIPIYDLVNIPQDPSLFTKNMQNSRELYPIQEKYEKYYFSMWNTKSSPETLKDVKWPFVSYKAGKSYGENLQLIKQSFFDEMLEESNFKNYSSVNKKAITLKHLNLRAFPSLKPLFMDPSRAGEGFPFDYLQNSTVQANKPVFVSHFSKNREWSYIFSSFASGWVKTDSIVFLKPAHTEIWQKSKQIHITKDSQPIYGSNGKFLFNSKVGMMFPLISEDSSSYTVLSISSYKGSLALFVKSKIPKNIATKNILSFNADNLGAIMNELLKNNYGWGGMYEQRDCSSTLRDMFAPFGIWLPRNSSQQAKVGKVINLQNLTQSEKLAIVKEKAVPFKTLLYKKGHIVLYVGTYNSDVVVFHNTWGIKTLKDEVEGRIIIGKTIFSTLELGKNQKNYDEESSILKNLKSMNILTK